MERRRESPALFPEICGWWERVPIRFGAEKCGMRKISFLIAAAALLPAAAPFQGASPANAAAAAMSPEAKSYLDEAIALFRENHINASKMDWPALTQKAYAAAAGAKTTADTYPAIRLIIEALGEKHTLFVDPEHARATRSGKSSGNAKPPPLMLPEAMRLANGVGLVRLYRMQGPPEWEKQYSTTGKAKVAALKREGVCKFVLDLRDDWGGSMYPMIDAVSGLLKDGVLGRFVHSDGTAKPWVLKNGTSTLLDAAPHRPIKDLSRAGEALPVAVLIGAQTSSAGEFTAMSFEGRPNTRFFGAPSGGYITANLPMPLPDGAVVAMSIGWGEDRSGKKYVGRIEPDEVTGEGGAAMDAALKWLAARPCPGGAKRQRVTRR
jgi:carboxyl-terminal processing protease